MKDVGLSDALQTEFAKGYLESVKRCLEALPVDEIVTVLRYLTEAYAQRRQVLIVGNGGSAATASHMACDLAKNVSPNYPSPAGNGFRVCSLADNVGLLTALANDRGYDRIFADQVENLAQPGDVVVAISASGNSRNILEAIGAAKRKGAATVGFFGFDGGAAAALVDACVIVRTRDYGHVEDIHLMLNHLLTAWFRERVAADAAATGTCFSSGAEVDPGANQARPTALPNAGEDVEPSCR